MRSGLLGNVLNSVDACWFVIALCLVVYECEIEEENISIRNNGMAERRKYWFLFPLVGAAWIN